MIDCADIHYEVITDWDEYLMLILSNRSSIDASKIKSDEMESSCFLNVYLIIRRHVDSHTR